MTSGYLNVLKLNREQSMLNVQMHVISLHYWSMLGDFYYESLHIVVSLPAIEAKARDLEL